MTLSQAGHKLDHFEWDSSVTFSISFRFLSNAARLLSATQTTIPTSDRKKYQVFMNKLWSLLRNQKKVQSSKSSKNAIESYSIFNVATTFNSSRETWRTLATTKIVNTNQTHHGWLVKALPAKPAVQKHATNVLLCASTPSLVRCYFPKCQQGLDWSLKKGRQILHEITNSYQD